MNEQLLKILISLGTVCVLLALLRINNNRKTKRALQFPYLIFTPLLMAAEIVCLVKFRTELLDLLDRIPYVRDAVNTLLSGTGFFHGIEILFLNVLLVVPYMAAKLLLRPLFSLLTKAAAGRAIRKWYEDATEKGIYFLRNSQVDLRSVWGAVTLAMGFCTAAVCAIHWVFLPGGDVWMNLYPAAAWIVLAEVYWFLSGVTKEEYDNSVGGEDSSASEHSDYGKLKRVLENIFAEPLLTEHTGKEYSDRIGSSSLLRRMEGSEDKAERFAASYFLHLPGKKEGSFDIDLIKACVNLLHKRNTVIFNPFYHDLDDYLTLPFMNTLLSGRKILVICGRQSMTDDVSGWIGELLDGYCRTDKLWRTGMLNEKDEYDVGVLSFSNLYDPKIINGNSEFFGEVGFVLLVESSRMLTTAQAGLGIVVGKLDPLEKPVICAIDRDADGLVDLLSHLFLQEITDVVAAPPILPLYTLMGWDAAGDYHRQSLFQQETHFLGNGTELAATALKYQIPEVSWFSEEKAPVRDLRWIVRQYYRQICKYAGIANSQTALDEKIHFISNPLDSRVSERAFLLAEDECCNLYATARAFLTRATKDLFVNIICENYLLRDYMRFNWRLFMSDPKAIPIITPHYSKTERNTIFRLVILMAGEPVREEYIRHELQMLGYMDKDVYSRISSLITKYLNITHTIISVTNRREFSIDDMPIPVMYYQIPRKSFDEEFAKTLRSAYFIVEDEKMETEHIDARMFDHITQIVMPGQQIIHGGKVYRVHKVSPDVGCILHRAADLYMSRLYYRQFRKYTLHDDVTDAAEEAKAAVGAEAKKGTKAGQKDNRVISRRIVGDIDVTIMSMDFSVSSDGYLEMTDQHDLRTARKVDLSKDPCITAGTYRREYKNKSVMRLKLKGTDVPMRYTISLILSEILKTIFPYSWPFIAVLAEKPLDSDGMLACMTYDLEGERDGEAIYILEDSLMDLGLLEAIDQNLFRLFEIIADYLNWHTEKMAEPPEKDPVEVTPLPRKKKRSGSFIRRIWERITGIFKPKKKGGPAEPEPKTEEPKKPENEEEKKPFEGMDASDKERVVTLDTVDTAAQDGAKPGDKAAGSAGTGEDDTLDVVPGDGDFIGVSDVDDDLDIRMPVPESKYDRSCFLKFGYDDIDPAIAIEDLRVFLNSHGFGENSLKQARKPIEGLDADIDDDLQCDFCGQKLTGVQYERLNDGRIRCGRCAATAINSVEGFRSLLKDVIPIMEDNFRINIRKGIEVRIVDAKKLGKLSGVIFKPTPGYDGRVIGLAVHRGNDKFQMYFENGSPRLNTLSTMAHELTHIWQYQNWKQKDIRSTYGKKQELLVYEGMASWVQVQVMYILGEATFADDADRSLKQRQDEYGIGYRMFVEKYGIDRNGSVSSKNPFHIFPPL